MTKTLTAALAALAVGMIALTPSAKAACWWTGYGWNCAYPPPYALNYAYNPYPYYPAYYPTYHAGPYGYYTNDRYSNRGYGDASWQQDYPGPKLHGRGGDQE